jgi:uncharacterized protein YdhG (YjbR/CyaY superfamily)
MNATTKQSTTRKSSSGFTEEERAAIRERAQEVKPSTRRGKASAKDGENELLAKIAEMSDSDRAMGERVHAIITASAPTLAPTTWYGMPAYARNGDTICFFQPAAKFKTRYATLGFSDKARLDEGGMWPNAYAVKELTADVEAQITALVKKAVG